METKHTPGPWRCGEQGAQGYDSIRIHTGKPARNEAERRTELMICDVFGHSAAENRANARLIAAAPELLAALEELLVITADRLRYQGDEVLNARAAIAQAKGEAV